MPTAIKRESASRRTPAEVKKLLLDALEDMLEEGLSYDNISVEAITSRADCAKTVFYRRYPDKDACLTDLFIERILPRFHDQRAQVLGANACRGMTIREIIYRSFRTSLEWFVKTRQIAMAMNRLYQRDEPDPSLMKAMQDYSHQVDDYFLGRLYERRDKIGVENLEEAAEISETCASLLIREMAFHTGKDNYISKGVLEANEKLLQGLTEQFMRNLQVDESEDGKEDIVGGK